MSTGNVKLLLPSRHHNGKATGAYPSQCIWYVLWHTLAPRGVAASGPEGAALNLRFFVLPDASPNAFALPGGFVFVHAGLLAFADSADEATESARAHRHY